MATTYTVQPVQGTVRLNDSGKTVVTFRVTRSGDVSAAATIAWDAWDDEKLHRNNDVDPTSYKEFASYFFSPDGYPSGIVSFAAYETSKTFSLTLDQWPDSGDLSFAVRIKPPQVSTSINESNSGGVGVTEKHYIVAGGGGTFKLDYDMYGIPDSAQIFVNGASRASTPGAVSYTGSLSVSGLNANDDVKVVITGTSSGTAWDYTVSYSGGLTAPNVFGTQIIDTGKPSIAELARFAEDVYDLTGADLNGWTKMFSKSFGGFQGAVYTNKAKTEVVVAFRGTSFSSLSTAGKNLGADLSFGSDEASEFLNRGIEQGVTLLQQAIAANPSAHITLTGHSLGGAMAQIIGSGAGFASVGFDAPGGGDVFETVKGKLAPVWGASNEFVSSNYRLWNDQVSLFGKNIGTEHTVYSPLTLASYITSPLSYLGAHSIARLKALLIDDQTEQEKGLLPRDGWVSVVDGAPDEVFSFLPYLVNAIQPKLLAAQDKIHTHRAQYNVQQDKDEFFDPSFGKTYLLIEEGNSPALRSITLPELEEVAYYKVQYLANGVWSAPQIVAENARYTFTSDSSGVKFEPFDAAGHHVLIPSSFVFAATYASAGTVTASFIVDTGSPVGSLAKFDADGDGRSDMLWRNDAGSVGVWKMNGAAIGSAGTVGSPSNDFHLVGTGDFNGDGKSDLAWRNEKTGGLSIWQLNGSQLAGSGTAGAPGPDWHVAGFGDFNGDHKTDVVWRHDNGTVGVWLMNGTQIQSGGNAGAPDNGWNLLSTADFNGDGKSDMLWRTDSGTVGVWLMNGAQIQSGGNAGAPDPSYYFSGTGDFNGDGKADILWRNTDGSAGIWLMNGAQIASGGNIGTPGNAWHVETTGDFNGDHKTDILWRHDDGTVGTWLMNGTTIQSGGNTGQPGNNWQILGTGDFNNDGKTDISWQDQNNGTVGIWLINGAQIAAGANPAAVGPEWTNYHDQFWYV